jgi:prepilin-type processing-associated H-X9-DG protein
MLYSNQFKGAAVPAYGIPTPTTKSTSYDFFVFFLMATNSLPFAQSSATSVNTRTVFWCPAADPDSRLQNVSKPYGYRKFSSDTSDPGTMASNIASKLTQNGVVQTWYADVSYGINGARDSIVVTGDWVYAAYAVPTQGPIPSGARPTRPKTPRKLSDYRSASKVPLLVDGAGDRLYGNSFWIDTVSYKNKSPYDDNITGRHGKVVAGDPLSGSTNILFLDGHAASYLRKEVSWDDPNTTWTGPDPSGNPVTLINNSAGLDWKPR